MSQLQTTSESTPTCRLTVAVSLGFIGVLVFIPVVQFLGECWEVPRRLPTALKLFAEIYHVFQSPLQSSTPRASLWTAMLARNEQICLELRAFETEVTTSVWPIRSARERLQRWMSQALLTGNEQVICGRDHEFYFRPDVDAITGPGFLRPEVVRPGFAKSARQTNPVPAIQRFAADLRNRGIDLILVPIPSKASIELNADARGSVVTSEIGRPIHNVDFQAFVDQFCILRQGPASVREASPFIVADLAKQFLTEKRSGVACYLKTDTHWSPAGLEIAARHLASDLMSNRKWGSVLKYGDGSHTKWKRKLGSPLSRAGDTTALLGNSFSAGFDFETQTPHPVVDGNGADWASHPESKILLLGDSFLNIYSQSGLGWGTSAGFAEHLSLELGIPLDCIAINSGGALGSRQELIRQMQRKPDRLAGKSLVVWLFAERELSFGDWQVLPLPERKSHPETEGPGSSQPTSDHFDVGGTIVQVGRMPSPQSMPYREALLPVHLKVDIPADATKSEESLRENRRGQLKNGEEIVVYVWGFKDRKLTSASKLRAGQTIKLRIVPWEIAEKTYGRAARIELDDPDSELLDLPAYWGEILDPPLTGK